MLYTLVLLLAMWRVSSLSQKAADFAAFSEKLAGRCWILLWSSIWQWILRIIIIILKFDHIQICKQLKQPSLPLVFIVCSLCELYHFRCIIAQLWDTSGSYNSKFVYKSLSVILPNWVEKFAMDSFQWTSKWSNIQVIQCCSNVLAYNDM